MSAVGHQRTLASKLRMSALPLKADVQTAEQAVRFVPRADSSVDQQQLGEGSPYEKA